MKTIHSLSLLLLLPFTSFAQPIFTDSFAVASLREDFKRPNKFSQELQLRWVEVSNDSDFDLLSGIEEEKLAAAVKGKRVLILIHGMGTPFPRAKNYYRQVIHWADDAGAQPYDMVIGLLWPGYQLKPSWLHNGLVFFKANPHARKSGKKLSGLLAVLAHEAQSVDLLTHRMGSKVALFALKHQDIKIGNLFLMAPSIGAKALRENRKYGFAGGSVRDKIIAFFSTNDPAFRSVGKKKMGHRGIENNNPLTENKFLNMDCSAAIRTHSAYWSSQAVFGFLTDYLAEQR